MAKPGRKKSLAALLACLVLAACGSPPPSASAKQSADPACAASPPVSDLEEPERARIEAFASQIEESMSAGDASFLIDRIDAVAMSAPAMDDPSVTDAERAELTKRARSISSAYGMSILRGMGEGGRYRLIRAARLGGQPAVIFRTVTESGSFDYHGWLVAPDKQGDFKLIDVHLFVLGQSMSSIIREVVSEGSEGSEGSKKAGAARRCPRVSLMMKLREARDAGDEARAAAVLDEVEKLPADDPARGSILLDRLIAKRRFEEAKSALEEMDRRVGGDPYLWALRGNILFLEGKTELAKTEIGRAVTADPSLEEGYLALIGISLKERRFKDTVRWLTTMRDVAGAEIASLESVPEHAEFIRSPEYAAMKAKSDRVTACNSLITVINTANRERERLTGVIAGSPADPAGYRAAAKASEEAARALANQALPLPELKAFSAEFQGFFERSARALGDAASALEARDKGRANEAIQLWKATLEVEEAATNRVNTYCQQ
jgi:tetratricopeptide (TPR) repeat protein